MKQTTKPRRPVGLTQDVGFEIGARRTFALSLPEAWILITSADGLRIWLGEAGRSKLEKGQTYQTRQGAEGEVRVVNAKENIRLTWRPKGWAAPSTIQVRVIPSGRKTVISFHQEHLASAEMRAQMRDRWQNALDELEALVKQRNAATDGRR